MTWKQVFTSSIGQKITMALSGIFLILFLVVHVGLNALVWANDGGEIYNRAANFLGANVVPRILEVGLFLFILLHIIQGLVFEAENLGKRGVGYAKDYGNRGSRWYSRSMGLLGTLILLFLIIHLIDFWIPSRFGEMPHAHINNGTKEVHNLYALMYYRFKALWVVIVYVLGCISLAYHLMHGFYSAFKTVGVYNKRYLVFIKWCGYAFSIVVPFVFAMMPICFYMGWLSEPMQ